MNAATITVATQGHGCELQRRVEFLLARDDGIVAALPSGADVLVLVAPEPLVPTVRALHAEDDERRIVLVLPPDRPSADARRGLKAGADAVVLADKVAGALGATLRAVVAGHIVVPRRLRDHVVRQPLSYREKQVLALVITGATNRQIADELFLAESTVKTHLSSAFAKLDARSRSEAAALILDPDEGFGPSILALAEPTPARAA